MFKKAQGREGRRTRWFFPSSYLQLKTVIEAPEGNKLTRKTR